MKQILPLHFGITFLFLLRLSNLSVRLSDTNIYFYTAFELLQGKMLYKDIFFTNLPLFPYISSLYLFFSGNNLLFYYFTPTIEISCIAILIYIIIQKKYNDTHFALSGSLLYLFSFMVLSTSEHQTGVFLASLFAITAYFFREQKKYIISGFLLSLMLLTKAYFLPIAATFFITFLFDKDYKSFFRECLGFILGLIVVLLPFFLSSRQELFNDVISYSLTRSAGVSKGDILWFFILKDCLFFILLIFNVYNYRKNHFFALLSITSALFFIFYTDPYYLYLNFLPPFLSLSLPLFLKTLQKNISVQKMVYPTILGIFLIYTFFTYLSGFQNLGTYAQLQRVTSVITTQHPSSLYGVNDAAPALAFLTSRPLLNNIIDTNPNIFRKGLLSATKLTVDAIRQKSILITHGAYYPEYSINQPIVDEIFDIKLISQKCKLIHSEPIFTEGITNRLNIFSCR